MICGSAEGVEHNHVGGRNHVAWFTSPLCRKHHDAFHVALRAAGVDLTYTDDKRERISRARMATLIFLWMLEDYSKNQWEEQ